MWEKLSAASPKVPVDIHMAIVHPYLHDALAGNSMSGREIIQETAWARRDLLLRLLVFS